MASYDVKTLSLSPCGHLHQYSKTKSTTGSTTLTKNQHVHTTFMEFCLKNTYLLFQGKYYEQVHGAAMGFPIRPLIANQFMEEFEIKAISSASNPPLMA